MDWIRPVLLTISLALPAASPVFGDDVAGYLSSIVRVVAKVDDQQKTGTGFVVATGNGMAFVVTAAHVVAGSPTAEVTFYSDRFQARSARVVAIDELKLDLAALQVWYVPPDVWPLYFDAQTPGPGEQVYLIGYPNRSAEPLVVQGNFSGLDGSLMLVHPGADEGNSGGPLIRDGVVVGLVVETDRNYLRALSGAIVGMTLAGWRVPMAVRPDSAYSALPADPSPESSPPPPPSRQGRFQCEGSLVSSLGTKVTIYLSPLQASSARTVATGEVVEVLERVSSETKIWYQIKHRGRTGYVLEGEIRLSSSCP